ncbi:FAM91 C-terminal domain [Trinorchestia longiramus]|nr:FAM91 C-terminal domain [Trinorchestia longiramus]
MLDAWSRCSAVVRAVEELQLYHSFGYLQLVAFPHSPPAPPTADGDDLELQRALVDGQDWMLHSCHLGMPLFSSALNEAVSRKVARLGLLSDGSVSKFVEEQRYLVEKLDTFILKYKDHDGTATAVPRLPVQNDGRSLPSVPLHFCRGRLDFWDGR